MGRKAKFNDGTEVPSNRGRGKKAKKQGDPTFSKRILVRETNTLSHRPKQRAKNRLSKQQLEENTKKLIKKKANLEEQVQLKNKEDILKQLKQKKEKQIKIIVDKCNKDEEMEIRADNLIF